MKYATVDESRIPLAIRQAAGYWALACARDLRVDLRAIRWAVEVLEGGSRPQGPIMEFDGRVRGWAPGDDRRSIVIVYPGGARPDTVAHEVRHVASYAAGWDGRSNMVHEQAEAEAYAGRVTRHAFGDRADPDAPRRQSMEAMGRLPGIHTLADLALEWGLGR